MKHENFRTKYDTEKCSWVIISPFVIQLNETEVLGLTFALCWVVRQCWKSLICLVKIRKMRLQIHVKSIVSLKQLQFHAILTLILTPRRTPLHFNETEFLPLIRHLLFAFIIPIFTIWVQSKKKFFINK